MLTNKRNLLIKKAILKKGKYQETNKSWKKNKCLEKTGKKLYSHYKEIKPSINSWMKKICLIVMLQRVINVARFDEM